MALDANILFQSTGNPIGRAIDVNRAIQQNQLLGQQRKQASQQIAQNQQLAQQEKIKQGLQRAQIEHGIAQTLAGIEDPKQRAVAANKVGNTLKSMGLPNIFESEEALSNEGLSSIVKSRSGVISAVQQQTQNNVQSKFVTDNGTIGLVFRDGTTKDTGVKVSDKTQLTEEGLVFNPRRGDLTKPGQVDSLTPEQIQEQQRKSREAKASAAAEKQFKIDTKKESVKASGEIMTLLPKIEEKISLYGEAIDLIDKGAGTGPVEKLLPSFRSASVELDNLQKRMGINVIGQTAFGNLSEGEMKLATELDIPPGLDDQALKAHLIKKRDAQEKMRDTLENAALFLARGGTRGDLLQRQITERQKSRQNNSEQFTSPSGLQINFTVE